MTVLNCIIALLIVSGILFWLTAGTYAWAVASGRLRGRKWLTFDLRTLFDAVTLLVVALGVAWHLHRTFLLQAVIQGQHGKLTYLKAHGCSGTAQRPR